MSDSSCRQCRFCDRVYAGTFGAAHHMRRDHGLWLPIWGGQKMLCVCGAIYKDAYRLCNHYRELSEESFVDHVLVSRLQ